jgi:hypothetical protein
MAGDEILQGLAIDWALQQLDYAELPDVAAKLLQAGVDSPATRQLAGLDQPVFWSANPLFERMMKELSVD